MNTDKRTGNGKLPEIANEGAGIPTFVFKDSLGDRERPTQDKKILEVALWWGDALLSVMHYDKPRSVSVGDGASNDIRVASNTLTTDRFTLLQPDGDGFVVRWTDAMALEVQREQGNVLDKATLSAQGHVKSQGDAHTYRVNLHDRVAIQLDKLTFIIQYVSPSRLIETGLWKTIDYYFISVLGFAFLFHAFVLAIILFTPTDPGFGDDDLFKNPNRFAQVLLKMEEKKPEKKPKQELSGKKAGGKHKDKEGKFGKVEEKKKDALASQKGAPRVDPNKREKDRKIAMESGLFAALKGQQGAVSDVFGPGGLGSGINSALCGLRGSEMGTAGGTGGLGSRGAGPGGGGNSLGIGGLGGGSGYGTGGMGDVDLGGRGKGKYNVEVGRTVTKGCLTQEVVLRVLNRVQSQAKYCYEKELQRNPNLEGKVACRFVIGATGSVQTADVAESTMGNANVEQCLVRVVQRLKFPPCAGGGVAEVTYPWIFKAGGGQ